MPVSQTRTDLTTAITLRIQTLGHTMSAGEIEAIVNDVEKTINTDAGTALADCAADVASFPTDPEILGG